MPNAQCPMPHAPYQCPMPHAQFPMPILNLLQLASPALPIGAYSYSEGLETLVSTGTIHNENTLNQWIEHSLKSGSIRLEAALMLRGYRAASSGDLQALQYWNYWATAAKETEELRQQSAQMGSALNRLLIALQPELQPLLKACGTPSNFSLIFGIAAQHWQIEEKAAILGYLHSWASNIIGAGVKLIPLGQTSGQQLLFNLSSPIITAAEEILTLEDDNLNTCSWGLSLASMQHETLYTRLFRS